MSWPNFPSTARSSPPSGPILARPACGLYQRVSLPVLGQAFLDVPSPGVVITDVEEGSQAAAAGLKKGQVIRRVGDGPCRPQEHSPRPLTVIKVQ